MRPGNTRCGWLGFVTSFANEDATSALFAACDALSSRGVSGKARVSIDRKLPDGRTLTRYADIEIGNPPWFGNANWKEVVS